MSGSVPWRLGRVFACALAFAGSARADDASPWQTDAHSAVRLLAGSRSGSTLLGGIAFQLAPGWKTYWRTPGDSGVPPRLDFSKSENIETVTILWPAPMAFDDGNGGQSLGYKTEVVLPLRIVAKSNDRPVTLRATINYAVCEKLCVPVDAQLELAFTSVASGQDATLFAALDAVPKPATIGDTAPLTIRSVTRDGSRVVVDVVAPNDMPLGVFVEGPSPDWALPVPKQQEAAAGRRRFAFDLEGLPPGANASGAALRLTLVGAGKAYEFTTNLN